MDRGGWHYPSGDIRVSDADRDQALSELRDALQVGRITAEEFDERAGQALGARTGTQLTALLADLPVERPAAHAAIAPIPARSDRMFATRVVIGASAVGTAVFAVAAAGSALIQSQSSVLLPYVRHSMPIKGAPPAFTPSPSFHWTGVITPAAIAVLLALVAVCLTARLARTDRA
jgi:predicted phage tail protein